MRIDEAAEGESEETLLDALAARGLVAVHGLAQAQIARAAKGGFLCGCCMKPIAGRHAAVPESQ